jgi:hypothetical protein
MKTVSVHKCHRCRKDFEASGVATFDGPVFCQACFRQNVRDVEPAVLRDYVIFGARARSAAASIFLDWVTREPRMRKFAALKIYEELMLATEDLAMVYFALRDRASRPVLETLLHFNLNPERSQRWCDELTGPDDSLLEKLGLMVDGRPVGQPVEPEQMVRALKGMLEVMRVEANNRTELGGVMVQGLNKLKHGFVAVSLPEWIRAPYDAEKHVAVFHTDREFGQLNTLAVEANTERLKELTDIVLERAHTASCAIETYIRGTYSATHC